MCFVERHPHNNKERERVKSVGVYIFSSLEHLTAGMAPPTHTQPTDDMVERAKRAVKRKMKPFEEAANSLSEYLKGEKAEIDEGEIRIDQLKHLYDD